MKKMTKIKLILSNGRETDWREVDMTDTLVIDLTEYDETREITDIDIENEGELFQKEGNTKYVYDNPEAPTLPPKRNKQPWEMF
jgi:hypothetical protein